MCRDLRPHWLSSTNVQYHGEVKGEELNMQESCVEGSRGELAMERRNLSHERPASLTKHQTSPHISIKSTSYLLARTHVIITHKAIHLTGIADRSWRRLR